MEASNMTVITIANQKGGVGKTTTALCIAEQLQKKKKRVLLIDMDPQCNATTTYQAQIEDEYTMYDYLNRSKEDTFTFRDMIQHAPGGDIVANDYKLAGVEAQYAADWDNVFVIKHALEEITDDYDFVIFDTPPTLGFYMKSALIASDGVIIPIKAEKYAVDGLGNILDSIERSKEFNPRLQVYGVVLTVFDKRNGLDVEIERILPESGEQIGFPVFKTVIRVCQQIKDAQNGQQRLIDAYPKARATEDYRKLVNEILRKV